MTLQQGPVPVSGVFPVGVTLAPSGDWASGNPAFAISRGSPGASLPPPGHDRRFPGMLFSPFHLSTQGSAIRSRDLSSHLCPLRGRYNAAPRGAATTRSDRIERYSCVRLVPECLLPSRSTAGSGVDRSWADSSVSVVAVLPGRGPRRPPAASTPPGVPSGHSGPAIRVLRDQLRGRSRD